jgi:erythromycin esterase
MFHNRISAQPIERIAVCMILALVLSPSCPTQVAVEGSQRIPPVVVQWARAHARPLEPLGTASAAELEPFAKLFGHARVIGLGEADHGIHEFLAFRNRLVQFAVETFGVTAIAAETGFTESVAADDYVLGRGEFSPAVATSVFSWSSVGYEENRALLDWIRSYNTRRATDRKVHFYGIDLTGGRAGRFVEARRSVDAALDYAAALEPAQERAIRSRLEPLEPHFASGVYDSLTAEQQCTLTAAIDDLVSLFKRRSAAWTAATSKESFNRALGSAIVAQQLNANFRSAAAESNPQAQRESAMAENLIRVLQQEGEKGRVLLYEANWHISKGPMATDRFGSSLGEHLRSLLGADYVAIAASFGEKQEADGGKTDASETPDPASTAALLSSVCHASCWVNLLDVPIQGPVMEWFYAVRPIQGGRVDQMNTRSAFDAQVFIRTVHSARKL